MQSGVLCSVLHSAKLGGLSIISFCSAEGWEKGRKRSSTVCRLGRSPVAEDRPYHNNWLIFLEGSIIVILYSNLGRSHGLDYLACLYVMVRRLETIGGAWGGRGLSITDSTGVPRYVQHWIDIRSNIRNWAGPLRALHTLFDGLSASILSAWICGPLQKCYLTAWFFVSCGITIGYGSEDRYRIWPGTGPLAGVVGVRTVVDPDKSYAAHKTVCTRLTLHMTVCLSDIWKPSTRSTVPGKALSILPYSTQQIP